MLNISDDLEFQLFLPIQQYVCSYNRLVIVIRPRNNLTFQAEYQHLNCKDQGDCKWEMGNTHVFLRYFCPQTQEAYYSKMQIGDHVHWHHMQKHAFQEFKPFFDDGVSFKDVSFVTLLDNSNMEVVIASQHAIRDLYHDFVRMEKRGHLAVLDVVILRHEHGHRHHHHHHERGGIENRMRKDVLFKELLHNMCHQENNPYECGEEERRREMFSAQEMNLSQRLESERAQDMRGPPPQQYPYPQRQAWQAARPMDQVMSQEWDQFHTTNAHRFQPQNKYDLFQEFQQDFNRRYFYS
eukprot:TRINITY_DN7861_c0_g1_i10.p1 TRINITY_DN7861_c0_g1~~TRINITY_DN7861_c0_g1_i10.p1  ORF type:complete len:302 (-),score=26.79 TRINITY_DN7861_c0_g1_i10:1332-2216(-)